MSVYLTKKVLILGVYSHLSAHEYGLRVVLLLCLLLEEPLLVLHLHAHLLYFTAIIFFLPNHVFEIQLGPIVLNLNPLHVLLVAVSLVQ